VICDQTIRFNGFYPAKHYPEHLRRIRFKDPESGKTLVFLTNNTTLPASTIAALYKSRWQVELRLEASLCTLLQILSVSVFEKTPILCALQPDATRTIAPSHDNQMMLFDF
jgi:hypothetical protein